MTILSTWCSGWTRIRRRQRYHLQVTCFQEEIIRWNETQIQTTISEGILELSRVTIWRKYESSRQLNHFFVVYIIPFISTRYISKRNFVNGILKSWKKGEIDFVSLDPRLTVDRQPTAWMTRRINIGYLLPNPNQWKATNGTSLWHIPLQSSGVCANPCSEIPSLRDNPVFWKRVNLFSLSFTRTHIIWYSLQGWRNNLDARWR